ncbi:MAG: cation:proton antiporter [Spirochaetaceae bacterium]|nr:MAG: cation:proton antiporter [Spirochaetaceae bacterium]
MIVLTIGITCIVLTGIGIYGLLRRTHMIRMVLCFNILEAAALLGLVLIAYRPDARSPILRAATDVHVLPLPHALALTAIVIGASLTALMLTLIVRVHRSHGTVLVDKLKDWRG